MKNILNPFEGLDINIISAGYSRVDSSWVNSATAFPYCRIYYVKNGHAQVKLKNKTLDFTSGKLYYIPAYSICKVSCEEFLEHYWVHFNMGLKTEQLLTYCSLFNETVADDYDIATIKQIVAIMNIATNQKGIKEHLSCDGMLKYLFSRFFPAKVPIVSQEEKKFDKVINYINENINRKITNEELSKLMFLNPNYFSNSFTDYFGVSPQQYILQKKLNLAVKYLFENKLNVKEIAFKCGFENEAYFNRQFKRVYGVPPGKFQKSTLIKK